MGRYFLLQHIQFPIDGSYLYLATMSNLTVNVFITSSKNHSMTPIETTVVRYNTTKFRIPVGAFYSDIESSKSEIFHVLVIKSDNDISIAVMPQILQYYYASYMLIPVQCYGLKYYVFTFHMNPFMSVLSAEPDTRVVININNLAPSRFTTLWAGNRYGAGSTLTITLQQEESFILANCNLTTPGELSGTSVEASKPVGVISGSCFSRTLELDCDQSPHEVYGADYAYDMLMPTSSYGKEFIVFDPFGREARCFVYVIALLSNTDLLVYTAMRSVILRFVIRDPKTPLKVIGSAVYDHKMVAKAPVSCFFVHLSRCRRKEEWGGPSISSLIPSELFFNMYAWAVPLLVGDLDAKHYVAIVIKRKDLDYLNVTTGRRTFYWSTVHGDKEWRAGSSRIMTPGSQAATTSNGACFAVYLYGHTWKASYFHPVGYSMTNVCPTCEDTVSSMQVNDFLDNDCDYEIDEEIEDGLDNDNDTRIDEDVCGENIWNAQAKDDKDKNELSSSMMIMCFCVFVYTILS